MFLCGPQTFFPFTSSFSSTKSHKLWYLSNISSFISRPAMEATGYRRKSSLKANMNKDFLAEDPENDMQEEEEEAKRKKACGKRGYSNNGGGGSRPSCQVEKCGLDLSDAKRYHKRHKVCERHAKAPIVIVAGIRQRFCQQCSRFHELSEFDEAKRSCRRRLAGHNERRRKSSAEASAEGSSSRKGLNPELKESHWRQVDDQRAQLPIPIQGNLSFKRSQIR